MTTTAIATREETGLAQHERNLRTLLSQYDEKRYHHLVPQTVMDEVPLGMRLVATIVNVDPGSSDVYPAPQGGKFCLGKAKLNEVSKALGADWEISRRVGDRTHPHYVEWEVVGRFVQPDGTSFRERGNKAIDMRTDIGDGASGAELTEIVETARGKNRNCESEVRKVRKDIQSLAETKAKNRAIRAAAALQTSYTKAELALPFVAVRLAPDPGSAEGSRAILGMVTGAEQALYGPKSLPGEVVDAEFKEPGEPTPPGAATTRVPDPPGPAATAAEEKYKGVGPPAMDESEKAVALIREKWAEWKNSGGPGAEFAQICKTVSGKKGKEDMTLKEAQRIAAAVDKALSDEGDNDDDGIPV